MGASTVRRANQMGIYQKLAGASAGVMVFAWAQCASADTIIKVTLMDKGSGIEMASDHGMGMANMDMPSNMVVKLSTNKVPAGDVTFIVSNGSKEMAHEMLVVLDDGSKLPYDDKNAKIDESKAGSLGEVSETEHGKSGKLKLKLKPGNYVLFCNIAGHFANGMWAKLTVE